MSKGTDTKSTPHVVYYECLYDAVMHIVLFFLDHYDLDENNEIFYREIARSPKHQMMLASYHPYQIHHIFYLELLMGR
jgi:hypothetical protein